MFRRNILNILLILVFSFVVSCSNKVKYQFSRKYSPIYNPEGEFFGNDEEFYRAYSIYKERRDSATSGISKNSKHVDTKKLRRKVQVRNANPLEEYDIFLEREDHDLMIDRNGVNLVDVEGAKFVVPIENDMRDTVHDEKQIGVSDTSVSGSKPPVKKVEDKGKLQDTKDKKVDDSKSPVVKTGDKSKLQDTKGKKVDDSKPTVVKVEDKSKLQDAKGKKVNDSKPPVVKVEDKSKLQDAKGKKVDDSKPTVGKVEDKNELQDSSDSSNDNQSDRKEHGLLSLLKFPKIEDDKHKDFNDELEDNKVNNDDGILLSQPKNSAESSQHIPEEGEQKSNHKPLHFLSFLKESSDEQYDVKKGVQKVESKNDQDKSPILRIKEEENVKIIKDDEQGSVIKDGDNDHKVVLSQEEEELLQNLRKIKEYDEDYTITYYYDDDNYDDTEYYRK